MPIEPQFICLKLVGQVIEWIKEKNNEGRYVDFQRRSRAKFFA